MSFEIIEISKTEKQAKFNINEKEVSDGFMEVAKLYQKDADEKGFRKGKVPLNIIESKYSKQILIAIKADPQIADRTKSSNILFTGFNFSRD